MLRLWAKIRGWFQRGQALLAAKVRAPRSTPDERRQWILALGSHPGFQLLVSELNNRRLLAHEELAALTRNTSFTGTAEDFRKIVRLQEQAYWAGWLQLKLEQATGLHQWLASHAADQVSEAQPW